MIPLDRAAVFLPRMPNTSTAIDEFPLTIIKPPVVDVKCYRLLRSRHHRRNSSASPVHSLLAIKTECRESSPERNDVLDAKNVPCPQHADSIFLSPDELNTCLLSNVCVNCTDKVAHSVRENVVSSAKRDEAPGTQGSSVIFTSTLSPCKTPEGEKSLYLLEDCSTKTKGKVVCVSPVRLTKRTRHRKSTRLKKTAKKKVNSLKRHQGAGHPKKSLSGPACCSKEQEQQKVHPSLLNDSGASHLNILKVSEAYAPKKNPNKGSLILLPKVYKRNLRKESRALSPRKWDGIELKSGSCAVPLSSPCKELDYINTASDDKVKKKVYLSEKHSGMIAGVPCVPPCTPTVDQLKNIEYILSLTDVKSQRAVKAKLSSLENKMKTEEQKRKDKVIKEEQKRTYGAVLQLKQRQRAEIYALNKVMTSLENENFRKFMMQTSVETLPV